MWGLLGRILPWLTTWSLVLIIDDGWPSRKDWIWYHFPLNVALKQQSETLPFGNKFYFERFIHDQFRSTTNLFEKNLEMANEPKISNEMKDEIDGFKGNLKKVDTVEKNTLPSEAGTLKKPKSAYARLLILFRHPNGKGKGRRRNCPAEGIEHARWTLSMPKFDFHVYFLK